MNELNRIVKEIWGEDGWADSDNEKPFLECAEALRNSGMSDDEIDTLLQRMLNAIRDEFGD